jgi:hypothetical protein
METAMASTEASPAAVGVSPRDAGTIEAVERARMEAGPGVRRHMMNSAAVGGERVIESVVESRSVTDIGTMIIEQPATMPVGAQ